jgi:hypothetical protein
MAFHFVSDIGTISEIILSCSTDDYGLLSDEMFLYNDNTGCILQEEALLFRWVEFTNEQSRKGLEGSTGNPMQ